MSATTWKSAAAALLALALAAIGFALLSSQQRIALQGPSALTVLADGSVWLGVEDDLWRIDAEGHRTAVVGPSSHQVPGLIANLVRHPSGALVASTRDDAALYVLDAATGAATSRFTPAWPADLARHGGRAITYAIHADGRIAISTGGGHAVALFDPQGRFLARSAPDTYEFTNGLWWEGEQLWTTDTNGFALVQLDGADLHTIRRVGLRSPTRPWRYLGMATGRGAAAGSLGSVVRFANGMIQGQVVQAHADGGQADYQGPAVMEPRDLQWRGAELLVVDGLGYAVRRFAADRSRLPDFGDATVRAELDARWQLRDTLQLRYHAGLAAGLLLFLAGFACALWSQRMDKQGRLRAAGPDLSLLGTPRLGRGERAKMLAQSLWPMLLAMAVVVLMQRLPRAADRGDALLLVLLQGAVVVAVGVVTFVITWRRLRKARTDDSVDAFLNQWPVQVLASGEPAFWGRLAPGELPRETLVLASMAGGRRWLVLTTRRLLVYAVNLRDRTLEREAPIAGIRSARALEPADLRGAERWQAGLAGGAMLRFDFADGRSLQGFTAASRTAARLVAALQGEGAAAEAQAPQPAQPMHSTPGAGAVLALGRLQALASLLLPGLGQWMQRRSGTALVMFVGWAVLLLFVAVPVAWAAWGPRTALPAWLPAYAGSVYLLVCVVSAADAWRMRRRA